MEETSWHRLKSVLSCLFIPKWMIMFSLFMTHAGLVLSHLPSMIGGGTLISDGWLVKEAMY